MSDLKYPHNITPAPGDIIALAPDILWLRMPIPASLDHINLYLLEDHDGWFVVDTGMGTGTTRELWRSCFADQLKGKPVKAVLVTHMHPDHVGQAGWLCSHWQAPLYMSQIEYDQAKAVYAPASSEHIADTQHFYHRFGLDQKEVLERTELWTQRRWPIESLPDNYIRVTDGAELLIADHKWSVLIGRGHSPEHVCLYSESRGILISGDQILPEITSNVSVYPGKFEQNPLRYWLESLAAFTKLPQNTLVLPAHNLPFYGLHTRAHSIIAHHRDNCELLLKACTSFKTGQQLLPTLFNRALNSFEMALAIGECSAHLNYLLAQEKLVQKTDKDGVYHYRATRQSL